MNSFLGSLPAVLAIVGFVIYQILKRSAAEDPIIKAIIEKLRYEEPDLVRRLADLTPVQKGKLLQFDYHLREKISARDRQLLDKALSHQFWTNIFVYALCAALLIIGLYFFLKPKALSIDGISIQNANSNVSAILDDVEPLLITWTSSGKDGEVFVALENMTTGKQSQRYRIRASEGRIKISPDKYTNFDKILSNRTSQARHSAAQWRDQSQEVPAGA
jgi:hypothetical protein